MSGRINLKALSEIYCEFYDKYYIRKHLVTTCQLEDCEGGAARKADKQRPGAADGQKLMRIEKLKNEHSILYQIECNSINQAVPSYYKMRSILNRKDLTITMAVTRIDFSPKVAVLFEFE